MSDTTNGRTKRALLIGIDEYPHLTSSEQLEGCVNDALAYRSILMEPFGFPDENIVLLTNGQADRDGILTAFDDLVARTEPDDIVVIQYSGHGSWCWDQEGDEPDGKDETIVPFDSGRRGRDNRDITDDEIQVRLLDLADKTGNITLIFDACHSGTITRDVFGDRARSLPGAGENDPLPPALKARHRDRLNESLNRRGPSGWLSIGTRYVLMAGCRDDERSYEHRVGDGDDAISHGALTFFLTRELRQAKPGTTYRDVFTSVKAKVTGVKPQQHPQIEGNLDREIFGVRDIQPLRSIRVTKREGSEVTLAGGAAHGMTAGSVWSVHEVDAREATEENQLGTVTIRSVRAVEATASVDEPTPGAVVVGAQAVERAHSYGDMALKVRVVSTIDASGAAAEALEALKAALRPNDDNGGILDLADEGERADACVYLLGPRDEAPPAAAEGGDPREDGLPVPQLGALDELTWAAVTATGQFALPPKPLDGHGDVVQNLRTLARYRHALALDNPRPTSQLQENVDIELLRKRADGEWVLAEPEEDGGDVVFEEGEAVSFRVVNRHDEDIYVTLVDFGLSLRIAEIFPKGRNDFFTRGKRVIGAIPLSFPDSFPYHDNPYVESPDQGAETFKFFVTTTPTDFSYLQQQGVRGTRRVDRTRQSPLDVLMRTAAGHVTREAGLEMMPLDEQDWFAVDLPFVLRREHARALDPAGGSIVLGSDKTGLTVRSRGLGGTIRDHGWGSAKAEANELTQDALVDTLSAAGLESRNVLEVEAEAAPAHRSVGEDPGIELAVRDPGAGWGQLVMSTDGSGTVRWHFAEEDAGEPPGESDRARGGRTLRYVVRGDVAASPAPPGQAAHRGLVGAVGKKFLKVLVFKLADPVLGAVGQEFAGRWEAAKRPYRLRTFTPGDYRNADGANIDGEMWEKLGAGRALLLVHGTFSRAHAAFGGMPRDFLEKLHARYEGRVFAFDHFTLSESPKQNIEWLLREAVPDGTSLDLDLVCHSRGGLVSRVLAEKRGELDMGSRQVRVDRVVFAGSPNAGTALADPKHIDSFINTYTNLLNFFPDNGVTDVLDAIVTTVKMVAVGATAGLKGLQSMVPGGAFEEWLNERGEDGARYFAMASDYEPADSGLKELLANELMDRVFSDVGGNDLVVPTASVYEGPASPLFPIPEDRRVVFTRGEAVGHSGYFGNPLGRNKILEWLEAEQSAGA